MSSKELKSQIHNLIDETNSMELLQLIFDKLVFDETTPKEAIWNTLSIEKQNEILNVASNSKGGKNCVSIDEMMRNARNESNNI
ncbi:MAG: hypothetical protein ABI844_01845 [Saprospiraceae bacterium]